MPVDSYDDIIDQLSLSEKVTLLSGAGSCCTNGLSRLNIPPLQVGVLQTLGKLWANTSSRLQMARMEFAEAAAAFSTP